MNAYRLPGKQSESFRIVQRLVILVWTPRWQGTYLFLMDQTGPKFTEANRKCWNGDVFGLYFCAVYDLPAGIFHDIKDMARKQENVYICMYMYTHTHTHTHTHTSSASYNPAITYGLCGQSIVCCLVLELLLKIGCHLQSSGHMFTQT